MNSHPTQNPHQSSSQSLAQSPPSQISPSQKSPEAPPNYRERLNQLRAAFPSWGIDGFIIPHQDEFLSEYLPSCAERLAWVTGFTGSAGYAVVLESKAVALTNGIYEIQIRREVDTSLYEIGDYTKISIGEWIARNCADGAKIGYDPMLITRDQLDQMNSFLRTKKIELVATSENPIDQIWHDRPAPPLGLVELFPDAVAGHTMHEKIAMLCEILRSKGAQSLILTDPASICWLLNVRGRDIDYNPLVLSYLILHHHGHADWYVDGRKITQTVKSFLQPHIGFQHPESFTADVRRLEGGVMLDPQNAPVYIEMILHESGASGSGAKMIAAKNPCLMLKAVKTKSEQTAIKQSHVRDGVAMVRFLYWLDCQDFSKVKYTEIDLSDKLAEFRKAHLSFRDLSFATISGWADHGAVIHYHARPDSAYIITGNDLYLLDSGAQYEYGTTDITRTIVIGEIDAERRKYFTAVLQGHIAVATSIFDSATTGADMDAKARAPLKLLGADYAHGTGHGVGCYLGVHEEATAISPRSTDKYFTPGMLLSNEPGYYRENHFGIRHESLMFCQENSDGNYYWETITLVPFDLRGVEWEMMSPHELQWLAAYHAHIFEILSPFLDSQELDWLRHTCFDLLPE